MAVQVMARRGAGMSPNTVGALQWNESASRTRSSLKQVRESHPPNTNTLDPTSVVVCARSGADGCPDVGARDQYIPDVGAAGTSGAA